MKDAMPTPRVVSEAKARLAEAALHTDGGWIPTGWVGVDDSGERGLTMSIGDFHFQQFGMFDEFELAANGALTLTARIDLPETIHGVPIAGEPLQLTINSLRPIDIFHNGRRIFGDRLPVVANGPALIELLPSVVAGDNGELRLDVIASPVPLDGVWATSGLAINLTTPSIRERFQLVDLAHARLLLAESFAETDAQRASVLTAAALVPDDLAGLTTRQLTRVLGDSNSLVGMSGHLGWLDDVLATFRIHCIGHSHIDLAWLWTYDDAREVILRDMRSVLALFDDYPEFRFTHSQSRGFAQLQESDPELFVRIRKRVTEGRLEPATMQWVESDVNLPSGPAQARQLTEGVAYSEDRLGVKPQIFLAPDTFGHAGNLPQLARQAGARVYYHHRANPGFTDAEDYWQAYWWVGDDGTRLLAVSTPVYLGPITATRLAHDLIVLGQQNGTADICYFYGVGDHGGGPTRADLESIRRLNRTAGFPRVRCSTLSDYASEILASDTPLHEFHGESARVFEGCYITHADGKQLNRSAENALVTAETLAAIAGLDAAGGLSEAWRTVLHHQFHDIMGGSAVAGAFDDQRRDADAARQVSAQITELALTALTGDAEPGTLVVTNPLSLDRRDLVRISADDRGSATSVMTREGDRVVSQVSAAGELLFSAQVSGLESRSYRLGEMSTAEACSRGLSASEPDSAGNFVIDTPDFRAVLRGSAGIITDLSDRHTGKTLVGRGTISPESLRQMRPDLGLGALVLTHELPHDMTSWVADENDQERVLLSGGITRVVERGSVRIVLETAHRFDNSAARIRTIFYADLPWIDYELEVDWWEIGTPESGVPGLAISFGTRENATDLWTESPFGAVRRDPDGYLSPMLRWADLGSAAGGLTVANDCKYGIDALGPRMRLHVIRSAYDPDPLSDTGRCDVSRYRVHPHSGPWQEAGTIALSAGLNQPLLAHIVSAGPPRSAPTLRPRVSSPSVILAGMQPASAGGVLLRLYESQGRKARATLSDFGETVATTDLLGQQSQPIQVINGRLELEFRPFEIKTLRVS